MNSQKGLTVIELVVGVLLSAMLLTALLRFLVAGYPVSRVTLLQADANEVARLQLKRMARELRAVRTAEDGSYALVEMTAQRLIFFADVDFDGVAERVRYELDGSDLLRGVVEPEGEPVEYDVLNETEHVVARNIRNGATDIFTYYSGDYPDDTTPLTPVDVTDVKYIQFYLEVDANTEVDPPPSEIRSQVQIRNLKTNLGQTTE